jgi:uncharacterized membrane-anchored protein
MDKLDELLALSENALNSLGESEYSQSIAYKTEVETQLKKEKVEDLKQNRKERTKYAEYTFNFLCWFCSALFLIIFLSGVNANPKANGFHLSDNVLITLITTSLSTVVGIFIFVMRYLFK